MIHERLAVITTNNSSIRMLFKNNCKLTCSVYIQYSFAFFSGGLVLHAVHWPCRILHIAVCVCLCRCTSGAPLRSGRQ